MEDIKSDREILEGWIRKLMVEGNENVAEIVREKAEERGWNNEKTYEAVMEEMLRQIEKEEAEIQRLIGSTHYGRTALQKEKERREKRKQSTCSIDNLIDDISR